MISFDKSKGGYMVTTTFLTSECGSLTREREFITPDKEQSILQAGDVMPQTLTPDEEAQARALYEEFWAKHPNQRNPSDINTPEKATFLIMKGFERIALMQRARKQAYAFTRPDEADAE